MVGALARNDEPRVNDFHCLEREIVVAFLLNRLPQSGDASRGTGFKPQFGALDAHVLDLDIAREQGRQPDAQLQVTGLERPVLADAHVVRDHPRLRQQPGRQIALDTHRRAQERAGARLEEAPISAPVDEERPYESGNERRRDGNADREESRIHCLSVSPRRISRCTLCPNPSPFPGTPSRRERSCRG